MLLSEIALQTQAISSIERIQELFQIFSAIAVIAGTIIALIQYISNSRDAKQARKQEVKLYKLQIQELEKDRVQRAIELSGYFKDNVICYMNILKHMYDSTGISSILNKIPDEKIKYFDQFELEQNISKNDLDKLGKIIYNKDFLDNLVIASEITGYWPECKQVILKEENGETVKKIKVQAKSLQYKFTTMVQDILNNLEYFAMAFTHKTADESVIYQSIHATYMSAVKLLYYDISINNPKGESRLFTNVIELYNLWKDRTNKQNESAISVTRENVSKGNVLKDVDN